MTSTEESSSTVHTHPFNGHFPGLPRWAGTRKVKTNLDFTEARDSEWQWHQLGKSAPHFRQITMPAPHHSVFYRPDDLPAAQPTESKHWRHRHSVPPVQQNAQKGRTDSTVTKKLTVCDFREQFAAASLSNTWQSLPGQTSGVWEQQKCSTQIHHWFCITHMPPCNNSLTLTTFHLQNAHNHYSCR